MRYLLAVSILIGTWTVAFGQGSTYRLQPGDVIEISVWQEPKLNRQVLVRPDGSISFPLVGHLRVAGQTLRSVEQSLIKRLQGKYTTDLDVTALLASTKDEDKDLIYVTGEVNKPGAFSLKVSPNVLQAIAVAGGFRPFAATSRIVVRRQVRGEDVAMLFNYNEYESARDTAGNFRLRPGDVVVVPERGLFE